jgi:hypothetical protein
MLDSKTRARLAGIAQTRVGNVAVFWRRNPDPERRKIELE